MSECGHLFDKWTIAGLREQWEKLPGTVTMKQGLCMVSTIESLLTEREALKAENLTLQADFSQRERHYMDEIDRLKAELEECKEIHRECHVNVGIWKEDRDLWKRKAEGLEKALRKIAKDKSMRHGKTAKAALDEFGTGV